MEDNTFQAQFELLAKAIINNDIVAAKKIGVQMAHMYKAYTERGIQRIKRNQSIWTMADVPPDNANATMETFIQWLFGWRSEKNGEVAVEYTKLLADIRKDYAKELDRLKKEGRTTSDLRKDLERRFVIAASATGRWMDKCIP